MARTEIHKSRRTSWQKISMCENPLENPRLPLVSKLITDRDFCWEESISDYGYRIALPEELISITETDLWEFQQKSLITDIDSLWNSN